MNDLNSVLIEGKINGDIETKTIDGIKTCILWIKSIRFSGSKKEISYFKIEATGKLAEILLIEGNDNRGLRIVGRLKQNILEKNDNLKSETVIIREHIEYRVAENA